MTSLEREDNGDWKYTDPDGDTAKIEWGRCGSGDVYFRFSTRDLMVEHDDVDAFINAIRDAANAECPNCEGTGRRKT